MIIQTMPYPADSGALPGAPASISDARAMFYAETLMLADGAAIDTWDSVDGSYTATWITAKPILETNYLNGMKVVSNGASTGRMTLPTNFLSGLNGTDGATVLYLGRFEQLTGAALFGDFGTAAAENHYPFTDSTTYEDFCSTVRHTTAVNVRDIMRDWHFGAMRSKTNAWDLWIEGASRFNTATNTFDVNTSTNPKLFFTQGSLNNGDWELPIWILFNRYLTDSEIREWEAYLNGLYSVADTASGSPDANTTFLCRFNTATPTDEVSGATATMFGNARCVTDKCQLVLDGNGDYITFPGGTINDEATANWTMEFHTGGRGDTSSPVARAASDATAGRHILYINASGADVQWYANFGAGTNLITGTNSAPVPGGERHIALVRDGGTYRIYVNGTQVSSAANAGAIAASADNLWIGNDPAFTNRYVQGSISRVKFSNVCRYPSGTTFTPPSRFDA